MKNVFKHSKKGILMVTLFATLLSFASEVSFYTIKNDSERTSITLTNAKQGNLISIKDNHGIVLYKETVQQTGVYTNGFDLTSLPNGSYIFELDKDLEINTVPFIVNSSNVMFDKNLEKTIFKPYIKVNDHLVFVTKLSLNKEPLSIDIYLDNAAFSTNYELIHSDKIKDTKHIEKVYKLLDLEKNTYKIVVKTENREFSKIIN
ncbi:hypothetical protein A8C32_19335 [Flavivirga aquatica]|uniref:Secretion system C-terminal sorting domain-containing protein n=1 Tax=Flavivirga aquatica TaxID=1849968 RepID=A0A1E5T4C8_9FLAO|nr:hypothetical protein [Flavivirga aquatica]OEK06181.1 hypothetical protein A8C32_19335 [Flavivirga aquatica]